MCIYCSPQCIPRNMSTLYVEKHFHSKYFRGLTPLNRFINEYQINQITKLSYIILFLDFSLVRRKSNIRCDQTFCLRSYKFFSVICSANNLFIHTRLQDWKKYNLCKSQSLKSITMFFKYFVIYVNESELLWYQNMYSGIPCTIFF